MPARRGRSIFSQTLDRAAFTAYFLGAVVPLLTLAVVLERFVLPSLADRLATAGLIGAMVSISALSLGSFLVLRTTARRSLGRMDRDNRRLTALFEAAHALSHAADSHEASRQVAASARALCGASASWVMLRREPGRPPEPAGSAGEGSGKLLREHEEALLEVTHLALAEEHPVLRGAEAGTPAVAAVPIPGETAPRGALVALGARNGAALDLGCLDALASLSGLVAVTLDNVDLRDAQRNFFAHVTDLLVAALDSHLGYNNGHSRRVAQLAHRVGRALGLDEHRLQRLHFGALLHDIGMLRYERSTHKSSRNCRKHPLIGARMIQPILLWREIAPIVQHHHEWFDGSGYPEGLTGDSVPLESRIIAACDAFDAMTSCESYKVAVSTEAALRELERMAGTQFDPAVVEAFQELGARGELGGDALPA